MNPSVWRRWWPLAAVAVLLALVAVAAVRSGPEVTQLDVRSNPATQSPPPAPVERVADAPVPRAGTESSAAGWLIPLLAGFGLTLVVAVVVAGLFIAVRDQWRRRPARAAPGQVTRARTDTPDVLAALDAGLVELDDADGDPRKAVIACWVRLERAAAAAGTPRHLADTPADLVTRLLAGHAVSEGVLAGFARVYREARYATHTVDDDMRAQARAALRRLRGELTGPDVAAVDAGPVGGGA